MLLETKQTLSGQKALHKMHTLLIGEELAFLAGCSKEKDTLGNHETSQKEGAKGGFS